MTQEEKFVFDLQGFLLISNVLSQEEVTRLNQITDRVYPRNYDESSGNRKNYKNMPNVSRWDPACQNLIDHPRIVTYLETLIGPHFRLDHDYSIFMNPSGQGGPLHGGPERDAGSHFYKHYEGTIRNGLSVVTFFLSDVGPGDGGFVCVPGSHKTNFLWDLPEDVKHHQRFPPYVEQPIAKAGDALLFTEARIHGTRRWEAAHERRTFLFKYSPGNMSWASEYYDTNDYANLTDQQRRILAPPSTGGRERTLQ